MGKGKRLWIAGLLSILAILLITPIFTHAQATDPGALNLTTSPLPINLTAKPGETVNTELRVKNSGTKDEVLKVGLMKFTAYGEEGKPQLKDREPGDDYFDWVSFSQNQFVAQPNEWKSIIMTIKVPKDAAFDYYYAVTFSRASGSAATQDQQAKVQGGTAVLVLLEALSPNAKRSMTIESFSSDKKIYEFLPATFQVKLANTGNVHLSPSGTIFIKRGKQIVDKVDVNITAGNVLPGSKRIFTASWDDGFPVYTNKEANGTTVLKNGKPVMTLNWEKNKLSKLRFGKYTANLTMTYDDGHRDVPLEASVSFWVIPWRLILFILIPLIAFGFLLYKYVRLRRRLKTLQKDSSSKRKAAKK